MAFRFLAAALTVTLSCPAAAQIAPAAPPVMPAEPDAARIAAARAVVDEVLPPAQRQAMFRQVIDAMMANMTAGMMRAEGLDAVFKDHPKAGTIFAAFVARQRDLSLADLEAHTPELIDAYVDAYAHAFTTPELGEIRTWFASPLGHKYSGFAFAIATNPKLAAWQRGVAQRGQQRLPTEIEKLMTDLQPVLKDDTPHDAS